MVCGSGQTGTVCITSSYYNSNYSSADSYESDFEDVNETTYNITTDVGLAATGLKGYSLAKAEEMLSKGANLCDVNSDYVSCNYNAYSSRCSIQNDGSVSCYGDSAQCDVNKGGGHYCGH